MRKNRFLIVWCLIVIFSSIGHAQAPEDAQALKARAQTMIDQVKYVDAVPLYEKLVKLFPNDPMIFRNFGTALLGQGANPQDAEARRQIRIRARDMFTMAKDLGDNPLFVK